MKSSDFPELEIVVREMARKCNRDEKDWCEFCKKDLLMYKYVRFITRTYTEAQMRAENGSTGAYFEHDPKWLKRYGRPDCLYLPTICPHCGDSAWWEFWNEQLRASDLPVAECKNCKKLFIPAYHMPNTQPEQSKIAKFMIFLSKKIHAYLKRSGMPHWAAGVTIVLLLIAIIGGDYDFLWRSYKPSHGFYTALRIAVSATSVYYGYLFHKKQLPPLYVFLCAAVALLFQPIAPIEMDKDIWCWIDVLCIPAIIYCCSLLTSKKDSPN